MHCITMDKNIQIALAVVKTKYPDFDQVFDDNPMFALVLHAKTFNTTPSIVFCEFTGRRGIKIEKVDLPFLPAACGFTPTELLKQQLDTIKGLVRPETDALQFSAISRELVKARSNYKHDKEKELGRYDRNACFDSFDIIHLDAWAKSDFKEIVSDLAQIVLSERWVNCKLYNDDSKKVITISGYNDMLIWVKDDESILALIMPEHTFLPIGDRFTFDRERLSDESRLMKLLTWNEMFESVDDVAVRDAGVVFLVLDDMIRYVYFRNINADRRRWEGVERPVTVMMPDDMYRTYNTFTRKISVLVVHSPFIANGMRLRELVSCISGSVERQYMPTNIKLILCLVLSALCHKNEYNFSYNNKVNYTMSIWKDWFVPEKLLDLISMWTAYISGQELCSFQKVKFNNSEFSIYEVKMHDRVNFIKGTKVERHAYWQFIPQKGEVTVFEDTAFNGDSTLLDFNDHPGNCIDLRARSTDETWSNLLMRINTLAL